MKVLVACEWSGRVRDAFIARGHDAMSCDLLPADTDGPHYQGDVRDVLWQRWDMMIAFPPCTYLSKAGARWWGNYQADGRQQEALVFVQTLMLAPIPRIAIENPVGRIGTAIRPADQIIQPWQFGNPWIKETCLWLKNLPKLVPTVRERPATVGHWVDGGGTRRAYRQRGQDVPNFGDSIPGARVDRQKHRGKTFPGIAEAMAAQWATAVTLREAA